MSDTQLAQAPQKQTALTLRLERRGIDQMLWSAIGASIFPGASDESKLLAFDYCKARGLDIMKKPCHIVPMNVKDSKTGQYGWRDVIMPGVSELRITASRTGEYAGQDSPLFGPMVEIQIGKQTHIVPEFCTVTVYRMSHGVRVAYSHTEFFEEACGTTKDGGLNSMWTKRKRGQLAKCAEAGALRKAFPEESGGIITAEEAESGDSRQAATPPSIAARATPIDPFATIPEAPAAEEVAPVVEAEVVDPAPEDHMEDPVLLDFLDQIQGCEDGVSLTQLVKPANDGFEGAKQEIAKRAIQNRAKELGVKWSKAKGGFEA